MSEYKDLLERIGDRVPMPEPAFDRMVRRRERRRRNSRISAVAVGAAITALLVFALVRTRPAPDSMPANTPRPSASNGLVAYTVPAESHGEAGIYFAAQARAPRLAIGADGGSVWCPAFSPDGTRFAFTRWKDYPSADVYVADVADAGIVGGSERPVATADATPCPEWAPDSQRLLYADEGGLRSLDVDGAEPPILILGVDPTDIGDVGWSPDGSLVAVAQRSDAYVRIVSARDGAFVAQAQGVPHGELSWSPVGDRIAIGQAAVDGHQPVRLITVEDGASEELTAAGRTFNGYGAPSWSPDGTSLALSDHSGEADTGIVIVQPDDNSWYRLPLPPIPAPSGSRLEVWEIRWSPDGQQLLVASGCSVHTMPADGKGPATLVSSPDVDPQACQRPPGLDWQPVSP